MNLTNLHCPLPLLWPAAKCSTRLETGRDSHASDHQVLGVKCSDLQNALIFGGSALKWIQTHCPLSLPRTLDNTTRPGPPACQIPTAHLHYTTSSWSNPIFLPHGEINQWVSRQLITFSYLLPCTSNSDRAEAHKYYLGDNYKCLNLESNGSSTLAGFLTLLQLLTLHLLPRSSWIHENFRSSDADKEDSHVLQPRLFT